MRRRGRRSECKVRRHRPPTRQSRRRASQPPLPSPFYTRDYPKTSLLPSLAVDADSTGITATAVASVAPPSRSYSSESRGDSRSCLLSRDYDYHATRWAAYSTASRRRTATAYETYTAHRLDAAMRRVSMSRPRRCSSTPAVPLQARFSQLVDGAADCITDICVRTRSSNCCCYWHSA